MERNDQHICKYWQHPSELLYCCSRIAIATWLFALLLPLLTLLCLVGNSVLANINGIQQFGRFVCRLVIGFVVSDVFVLAWQTRVAGAGEQGQVLSGRVHHVVQARSESIYDSWI